MSQTFEKDYSGFCSPPPLNRTEVDKNGYVTEYQSSRLDIHDSDYYCSKEYQEKEGELYKDEVRRQEEEEDRMAREADGP